jgi:2-polyprenyl-6-methoxyphenol hydroxylase-like FAD-dependent oxidoreductase
MIDSALGTTAMSPDLEQRADVLVVGAGPTGLVLALWLARRNVRVRIVDVAQGPGTTSRALAVHARTLELYRQLGIADDVVRRGLRFTAVNLWVRGRHRARAEYGDIGRGLSPFPFILIFPQDEHERLLIEHLSRAGVEVERGVEVTAVEDRGDRVTAHLKSSDGKTSTCDATFGVGCDGAHSLVRKSIGVGFPGGTYERVFYVADVRLRGPVANGELNLALDEADFVAAFPLQGAGAMRLVGTVKREAERERDLHWEDVSRRIVERMRIDVERVNWFSTYHVHHRVASSFRGGRLFLAGDAAHVHSPVGGQGMNTGIGDAVNLAWKLAAVVRREADESVLDTYEPERMAFARRLVDTTDRAFTFVTRNGFLARFVRLHAVPALMPPLVRFESVRRYMFSTLSQIRVNYRATEWNTGHAGAVRGGDRMPWVPPEVSGGDDDFTPLASLDWQVHVHGTADAALAKVCAERALPLHVFAWRTVAARAGLARDAVYLVRPDGYVAFADAHADAQRLERCLDARGLCSTASS